MTDTLIILKKKLTLWMLIVSFGITLISSLVLSPIYVVVSSNITFIETPLPDLLYYVISLLDVAFYCVCLPILILSFTIFFVSSARTILLIYVCAPLLRRALDLLMTYAIYHDIDDLDIVSCVWFLIFDYALLITVTVISCVVAKRFYSASPAVGDTVSLKGILPTVGVYSGSNPLQRSALLCALVFTGLRVISRIINDVSYGAPASISEILVMVIAYLSDILIGVVFYASALAVFSRVAKKLKE